MTTGGPTQHPAMGEALNDRRSPRRRRLGTAVARFSLLVLLLAVAFAALRWTPLGELLSRDRTVALLEQVRTAWWAPVALIGLYLLLSPTGLPVSPLIFAGGVVFGVWWGSLYNFVGTLLGASASYLLARSLSRDLILRVVSAPLLQRAERILERHGYWTLVRVRFLPIPFAIINFGAALAGIRWPVFASASVLGLAPSMVIWTYFGYAIFSVTTAERHVVVRNLIVAIVLALLLTLLAPLKNAWKRRRARRQEP